MSKLQEMIQSEFKGVFAEAKEEISSEVKEQLDTVRSEMSDFQTEMRDIKDASREVSGAVGLDLQTRTALGNTVKELFGVDVAEDAVRLKADANITTGGSGTGAELIFTQLHSGILTLAEQYGVLLRDASRFESRQHTYRLVFGENGTDHGGYDTEGASRDSDNEAFGASEVALKKWRKIIGVSYEALADSAPEDLGAYIVKKLAEHFGQFMDGEIHTKLTGSANAPTQVTTGGAGVFDPQYADFVRVAAKPKGSVLARSAYYMNRNTWTEAKLLMDSNNRPLIEANKNVVLASNGRPVAGQPVGFINEYPVYIVDDFANAAANALVAVFGDIEQSVAVVMQGGFGITSDKSQKFTSDIVLVKGSNRNVVELLHDGDSAKSNAAAYAIVKSKAS